MDCRKTHLINEKGEKLVVETRDFNISQQNGDGKYDEFYLDVDWYLANGYSKAEERLPSHCGRSPQQRRSGSA